MAHKSNSLAVEICNTCKRVLYFLASATANEEDLKQASSLGLQVATSEFNRLCK